MDIIVSHQLTDLDGLGAMVAAQKLYPEAIPVFVGRLHRLVKDFMALYRDEVIRIYQLKDVNLEDIKRVIIVDTNDPGRLGKLKSVVVRKDVEVIMYDHHPHQDLDWVELDFSQNVGSATTILVNRIIAERIRLNPVEATLFALAIHADTGSLTYLNTSPEDARALTYLLEAGANLKLINEFLVESLNKEQRDLFEAILERRRDLKFNGVELSLFSIEYDKYVVGINKITEKIKSLYRLPSLFSLVKMGKYVEVIGRSSDEAVDIGKICTLIGGGGHGGAGAARVEGELSEVEEILVGILKANIIPVRKVSDIMSSPVRTVTPDTRIEDIEKILKKYGHTGVVVSDNGRLKGIFSLRDLYKIKKHNLLHAPVKGYMSRDVITIEPEASVHQAQELMVKYNIGRLPVLKDNKLIGIVTRSDILASYYGSETPHQHQNRYGSSLVKINPEILDVKGKLNSLPDRVLSIIKETGLIAEGMGIRVFLVGGMVRDLFLGRKNEDLDLVVDGDLEELVPVLAEKLSGDWSYNRQFKTANIVLNNGLNIDLATARRERYHDPGELPEVEAADILEDLFRRDYTVNALALAIYPEHWGKLIDYFRGIKDLQDGKLRILHRFSFLDDPTRILRGIRLAENLGFSFEEETFNLIREALKMGSFSNLSAYRVLKELKILFQERVTENLFALFKELPVFRLLGFNLNVEDKYYNQLNQLESYLEYFKEKNYNIKEWLLRLSIFFEGLSENNIHEWEISKGPKQVLILATKIMEFKYLPELKEDIDPVKLYKIGKNLSIEEIILLLVKEDNKRIKENLSYYLEELSRVKIEINGNDIKNMGVKPGPEIKEILKRVFEARLRGIVGNRQEELDYARSLVKEME